MNCAPGKIGTPRLASVGATSAAVIAGTLAGAGAGAGATGCAGLTRVPGRGDGCGCWTPAARTSAAANDDKTAQRIMNGAGTEARRRRLFLCVSAPVWLICL